MRLEDETGAARELEKQWTPSRQDCAEGSGILIEVGRQPRPLGTTDVQLFTVVEVARLLGVGRSKVYDLLYRGELKSVKIGGSRRVRYSDLGEFIRYLDDAS
jgi:excisionase family DNA binding protein